MKTSPLPSPIHEICPCQDENFLLRHDDRALVAMANAGPNTNGSQFYITFGAQNHLDGKHVVFGRIEAGSNLLPLLFVPSPVYLNPSFQTLKVLTFLGALKKLELMMGHPLNQLR